MVDLLKHYIEEEEEEEKEGRGLKSRVTGQRKIGVKGAATLLGRSFLLIISCPSTDRSRRACCRLRTDPFWDGMTISRKWPLVEDVGIGRRGGDGVGVQWSRFQPPVGGDHVVASA